MNDDAERIIRLEERLEGVKNTAARGHERLDKLEATIRDGFVRVDQKLDRISTEMEPLNNWMNKGKGAITAIVFVSGAIGAALTYLFKAAMGKS